MRVVVEVSVFVVVVLAVVVLAVVVTVASVAVVVAHGDYLSHDCQALYSYVFLIYRSVDLDDRNRVS